MADQKFTTYLQQIQLLDIPRWSELPQFDLYMDQVVNYINKMLKPLEFDELTPAMINNYVKSGLVNPPKKKKYSQEQLGRLITISILKSVFAISDVKRGFEVVVKSGEGAKNYDFFVTTFLKTVHDVVSDFQQEVVISQTTKDNVVVETSNLVKLSCSAVVQRIVVLKLLSKLQDQEAQIVTESIDEEKSK